MKEFCVELEYFYEGDFLKEEFKLHFLNQNLVKKIALVVQKVLGLKECGQYLMGFEQHREERLKGKGLKTNLQVLEELRLEHKKYTERYNDLCTVDLFQERIDIIFEIFKKNGISDNKFCEREFWEENVDAAQVQAFLESIYVRGVDLESQKKKEMNIQTA